MADSSHSEQVAKEMYHVGEFGKASKALQVYCGMPGKQLAGVHLLGYAQYKAGELQLALDAFRQCASDDAFGADWQLLVEIQLELDHELEHKQHLTAL